MADNRTMAQMLQAPIEGYEDAIVVPPINANNFELKQPLIFHFCKAKNLRDAILKDCAKSKVKVAKSKWLMLQFVNKPLYNDSWISAIQFKLQVQSYLYRAIYNFQIQDEAWALNLEDGVFRRATPFLCLLHCKSDVVEVTSTDHAPTLLSNQKSSRATNFKL
ncbi:hypothetical protein Tco_0499140 [Tanacetum coccineum]